MEEIKGYSGEDLGELLDELANDLDLDEFGYWHAAMAQIRFARECTLHYVKNRRERNIALTKLDEALMWLNQCEPEEDEDEQD